MERLSVCYPRCTTCQRAERWLKEHRTSAGVRSIKERNSSQGKLARWYHTSELPLRKFFNTNSIAYREQELSKKLSDMSGEEQLALLSTDGILVKRPILIDGETMPVGFREKGWEEALLE